MSIGVLAFLFAAGVTVHNLEEAVWLPGWSRSAGRFHPPVGAWAFRFAVAVLTAAAWVVALLGATGAQEGVGAYLLCGYALAMGLNAFAPHLVATLVTRRYAPGTATGLALNLPIAAALLRESLATGQIAWRTFAWSGPAVVFAIVASIPALLAVGRLVHRPTASPSA